MRTASEVKSQRFGHAGYYILYNTDTGDYESLINSDEDHTHSELFELVDKGSTVLS